MTYHQSIPSNRSDLSQEIGPIRPIRPIGPKTKNRHPALHDERLDFFAGTDRTDRTDGTDSFVDGPYGRDGIDHDGSYRLGIGLIFIIESPGLDMRCSLITHRGSWWGAFSERAAEPGQSVIIECRLHRPASSVTPSLSSLKGCHSVTRVTQSQGSLRHCATTSK